MEDQRKKHAMNKLIIALIVAMILTVIGFVLSGIANATTQENIGQNKQKIIVTWLETNDTKTGSGAPKISISSEDFWRVFEPLLKQSINESTSSSE